MPKLPALILSGILSLVSIEPTFAQSPPYQFCDNACPSVTATGQIPTIPIRRFAGSNTWFNIARQGEGWTFSELPRPGGIPPVGLGVVYTYETTGAPSWLLLQGSFTTETDPRRILDGNPISVLNAPVFDGQGGTCPTCPWTAPTVAQRRYSSGQVTFHRPDLATARFDDQPAGGPDATLIPSELGLTIPMPTLLEGRWRFTTRRDLGNGNYSERNFPTHRCELTITSVPSPSRDSRFDAAPGQSPYWLPPSGAHVNWLKIDDGIKCLATANVSNDNLHVAYEPLSRKNYRAIALASVSPQTVTVPGPLGIPQTIVVSFNVAQSSRFTELFVQDANTVILREYGNNNPTGPVLRAEFLLTRAP